MQGGQTTVTEYRYDTAHNRSEKIVTRGSDVRSTVYAFNALNQPLEFTESQLTGSNRKVTYVHDNDGNRIRRDEYAEGISLTRTETYAWDHDNRLIGYTDTAGEDRQFEYDYRTRRTALLKGAETIHFVFSGGLAVQEYREPPAANLKPDVEYLRGSDMGGGVGGVLYTLRDEVPAFSHFNDRGDVTAKTDNAGSLTYQSTYEAFGTRTAETGENPDRETANTKPEDIPGYVNDGYRWRDLDIGAFLSRDPAGFIDGPNLYAYVNQNPWTKFDPEGLSVWKKLWNLRKIPEKFDTAKKLAATKDLWSKVSRSDVVGTAADGRAMVGGRRITMPDGAVPGQTYLHEAKSGKTYDVPISKEGWVDFSKHSKHNLEGFQMSGDSALDIGRANEMYEAKTGLKAPSDHTWHHSFDGSTMQLVPSELNNELRHTGGDAITRAAIQRAAASGGLWSAIGGTVTAGAVAVGTTLAPNASQASNFGEAVVGIGVDALDTVDPGVQDVVGGVGWAAGKVSGQEIETPQLSDFHKEYFNKD